jgi:cellulose biosynthesis protein BcsQ
MPFAGKTTTSATLAYQYAAMGHRVVLYDCDPQRSLSAWLLHGKFEATAERPYDHYVNDILDNKLGSVSDPTTLLDQIAPVVNQGINTIPMPARVVYLAGKLSERSTGTRPPVEPVNKANEHWDAKGRVFLVPGHRGLNVYDSVFATANSMLDMMPNQVITPAIPYHCILRTANEYDADIVILDLNPSGGWLNTALLMSSHYILVPTIADFFSDEMARNLSHAMIDMRQKCERFTNCYDRMYPAPQHFLKTMRYRFPSHRTKILGYILTRFSLAVGTPACPIQVNGLIGDELIPAESCWFVRVQMRFRELHHNLLPYGMVIADSVYRQLNRDLCVGKVRDYFALGDRSHQFSLPIIALLFSRGFWATSPPKDQRDRLAAFQDIFRTTVCTLENLMAMDRALDTTNIAFPAIGPH